MNDIKNITTLLKTITGLRVYSTDIPEEAPRPAVTFANIAYQNDRVLGGERTKRVSNWRITVSDSVVNLQDTIDKLESLDNTNNEHYQRIFVTLTFIEPKAQTEPYQRAFLDLTVYPK